MKERKKINKILDLFITMFKIGLFTFGGGYAMIALLDREFVERKSWIEQEEFLDLITIAESTPGPIAINSATYLGYKVAGIFGSLSATIAVCIPSFTIIYTISLFLDAFLELTVVAAAFRGIQACVVYLIMSAGLKLLKKMQKNVLSVVLFVATISGVVLLSLLAVKFSTLFYIIIGAIIGSVSYLISSVSKKEKKRSEREDAK